MRPQVTVGLNFNGEITNRIGINNSTGSHYSNTRIKKRFIKEIQKQDLFDYINRNNEGNDFKPEANF